MPKTKDDPGQAGLFGDEPSQQRTFRASSPLVPFGKFKDQPADLLLANADYALWMLNAKSAMLRRSHPALYHWLIGHFGAPDTTPEHNRLQNRFLEDDFCMQLFLHLNPGVAEQPARHLTTASFIAGWRRMLPGRVEREYSSALEPMTYISRLSPEEKQAAAKESALRALQYAVNKLRIECLTSRAATTEELARFAEQGLGPVAQVWAPVLRTGPVAFEVDGADAQYEAGGGFVAYVDETAADVTLGYTRDVDLARFSVSKKYRVEVKPFVGDDYPAILRTMVARMRISAHRGRRFSLMVDGISA